MTRLLASGKLQWRRFLRDTSVCLRHGSVEEVFVWPVCSSQARCRGGGSRVTRVLATSNVPWGRFSCDKLARLWQGAVEEEFVRHVRSPSVNAVEEVLV